MYSGGIQPGVRVSPEVSEDMLGVGKIKKYTHSHFINMSEWH